jgi:hypothetical protein
VVAWIGQGDADRVHEGLLRTLLMLAPLAALIGIGRFNARNEPSFLLDVLREALEAESRPPTDLR